MKYILTQDNSSHWYVIPFDKRKEWNDWLNIPEDNEDSWEVPDFADMVGGSPSNVVFEKYII